MRFIVLALLGFSVLFIFPGLGKRDFWPGDEARYGGVARDMYQSGDWAIPHLNGAVYGEKPPAYFWAVQGAAWLRGGVNEETSRWPAALAGIGLVSLCGFLAARATGAQAGFLSGMVLLATFSFAWQTRFAQLDLLFAFLMTSAGFLGFRAMESGRPRLLLPAGLCLGLAILVKGPLALLVVPILLLWRFAGRCQFGAETPWRTCILTAFLLAFLPVVLWLLWASQGPLGFGYVEDHLIQRNIIERSQKGLAHVRPWFFYLKKVPVIWLPWILIGPVFLLKSVRSLLGQEGRRLCAFSALWVCFCLLLQSLFPGKRVVYTFIFSAPLGILLGHALAASAHRGAGLLARRWLALVLGLTSCVLAVVGTMILLGCQDPFHLEGLATLARDRWHVDLLQLWGKLRLPGADDVGFHALILDLRLFALAALLAALSGLFLLMRRSLDVATDVIVLGLAAVLALGFCHVAPHLDAGRSRRALAERTRAVVKEAPLAVYRHTDEGLLWYLGGRLKELAGEVGELPDDLGRAARLKRQRSAAEKAAAAWLNRKQPTYLLIRRRDREHLETLQEGRDYEVLFSEPVGSGRWYDLLRSRTGEKP